MKPIYFPTTYVSPSAAAALRTLFPSVVTCQPCAGRLPSDMRTLQESGFLEVLTPVTGGEQRLDDMVREFRQWGRLHAGGAGLHAAFWRQRLPADALAEDGSSSQLVSQINSRLIPARGLAESDRLMPARVFLQLAQEFDRQSYDIQRDLARHEKLSTELLHALKGENDPSGGGRNQGPARGPAGHEDHLWERRLAAWARLFLCQSYPSPVFVTSSAAVVDHVIASVPRALRLLPEALVTLARPPVVVGHPSRHDAMPRLSGFAASPLSLLENQFVTVTPDASGERGAGPDVFVVPEIDPRHVFARFLNGAPEEHARRPDERPWRHTVLVRVPLAPVPGDGGTMPRDD
ncbi:MAG: hypothetical protein HY895_21845 [Deltaproteobacteria bacterium]|nr:hypothetical protein [Deltaproteobacteria bacterium]